ncbi:MAG: HNH endonuclease [Bacteroidales bacterium]|nr:HNH endonuclease [Bacteroidales bacterium]
MIRIKRTEKPKKLTEEHQKELTEKFKKTGEDVWNKKYLKDALLEMSHYKCCYCETKINTESKYLEVEHFHPKKIYKDEVILWENLLPSCKRCNGKKGEHDTKKEPILNPTIQIPSEHIFLKDFFFFGKDVLGENTIINLSLNDVDRIVTERFNVGKVLIIQLSDILILVKDYKLEQTNRNKNKIVERLENLMLQAIPKAEYSATCATVILNNIFYLQIRSEMKKLSLWSEEFENLEKEMEYCRLDTSE